MRISDWSSDVCSSDLTFSAAFAGTAIAALLPLIARDILHGDSRIFGLLLGAFGVGAVLGGLALASLRAKLSTEAVMRLCSFGVAAMAVGVRSEAVRVGKGGVSPYRNRGSPNH